MLIPIREIGNRVAEARNDSDVAYFYELLIAGEMAMKMAVAALVACLEPDSDRHRYRLEHDLVRSDGLGGWAKALDDCLTGPASQVLSDEARSLQTELTQVFREKDGDWRFSAVTALHHARATIDPDIEPLPARFSLRRWFIDFASLRNRTRAHGAPTGRICSGVVLHLSAATGLLLEHLSVFALPWVHLRRNLSGKYRVMDLGNGDAGFAGLRTSKDRTLQTGVYMWVGSERKVELLATDEEVRDFFLPNGGATATRYEVLSYITDVRLFVPIDQYAVPPTALPSSETQGLGALDVVGNVFSNLPPDATDYISRPDLEEELADLLRNDRHPVITLVGRGGIGKTSLALHVLHAIATEDRFSSIVWFSARDIDLLPEGPKLVRAHLLSEEDMAREFRELVGIPKTGPREEKPLEQFARALSEAGDEPTLFVFDNFETVRSPLELYRWVDTYIRSPNKVLITTRSRDFKGDYWLMVGGMTEDEFEELVRRTASAVGVGDLLTDAYIGDLYRESDGHPYVAKVLLGEVARTGKSGNVKRVMASQDHVLEALFERTYTQLSPAAQRLFLTLCSWRSLVPVVALDAAIQRSATERVDVESALDELRRSSLLEFSESGQGDRHVSVPLSAALFGKRKIATSSWKVAIEGDVEILQFFGPAQAPSARIGGFDVQVERLFRAVAERLQAKRAGPDGFDRYLPVLEFVSREQSHGWKLLGQLYEEQMPSDTWEEDAARAYRSYLESNPDDDQAWRALARVSERQGDYLAAIQTLIGRAQLPHADFSEVSYAAWRANSWLNENRLQLDTDDKRILLRSLVDVMKARQQEASATDLSRLAWLLLNLGREAEAKVAVTAGLRIERDNQHCRKLAERLKIQMPPG